MLLLSCYALAALGMIALFYIDYVSWKDRSVIGYLKKKWFGFWLPIAEKERASKPWVGPMM